MYAVAWILSNMMILSDAFLQQKANQRTVSRLFLRRPLPVPLPPPPLPHSPLDEGKDLLQMLRDELTGALDRLDLSQLQSMLTNAKTTMVDDKWVAVRSQIEQLDSQIVSQLVQLKLQLEQELDPALQPQLQKLVAMLSPLFSSLSANPTLSIALSALVSFIVLNTLLNWNSGPAPTQPYPLGRYDPISARLFFDQRLPQVIFRAVEILLQSTAFGLTLLKDKIE